MVRLSQSLICLLALSAALAVAPTAGAAVVTKQVYVTFDGSLTGTAYTLGAGVLLVEAYLGFYDPEGQRAGDTIAQTLVVEFQQESDANPFSDRRA